MAAPTQVTHPEVPTDTGTLILTAVDTGVSAAYQSSARPTSGQLWPRLGH